MPDDPRPRPPEEPAPGDCCGGGCAYCVNDRYAEELAAYREALAAWLRRHPGAAP
uniref:oxidoreductase-like domain-containing protein n=1 Tax=Fulvimonas soli TaxID=155197 RepID=UPI003CCC76BF